ncbi:MAG: prohibitin family protein [Ignavibacteriales bacterium]|nr:prohibitin family protein [Ignavibacteriales bacterium]MCF8317000.1 prohibitin family protein [Ignavibacteriales bacterium]MCF8438598.1 prohibitin family protein [Ignavibacteriales bacterium]
MLFIIFLIVTIISGFTFVAAKKKLRRQESNIAGLISLVGAIVLVFQLFTVVPAGTVGVVDFLGMVSNNTLKAGVNVVNPIANIVKFDIKTQEMRETMTVPSKEGLSVQLEISLLYSLDPEMASQIYKTLGPNYREIILVPNFRSVVRGVTAKYEAKALYTASRERLGGEIQTELENLVRPRGILIDRAALRQIILPDRLTKSIEEKLQAEQESQRMQFVLKKEEQEAERKRIEAKGIADFQEIVSKGISKQLLEWKGIEATEKLSNSPNSKIVIIGSGENGLPIILGGN